MVNTEHCAGGRLQPTLEEPYERDEEGDGDVEITQEAHNVMGDAGPTVSDVEGALGAVPFNPDPLLDNSAVLGFADGSQMQGSQMQGIANPRGPAESGVLTQAYHVVDSMGHVADHTVLPSDHLDTGAMISVPQVRCLSVRCRVAVGGDGVGVSGDYYTALALS